MGRKSARLSGALPLAELSPAFPELYRMKSLSFGRFADQVLDFPPRNCLSIDQGNLVHGPAKVQEKAGLINRIDTVDPEPL